MISAGGVLRLSLHSIYDFLCWLQPFYLPFPSNRTTNILAFSQQGKWFSPLIIWLAVFCPFSNSSKQSFEVWHTAIGRIPEAYINHKCTRVLPILFSVHFLMVFGFFTVAAHWAEIFIVHYDPSIFFFLVNYRLLRPH